MFFKQPTKQPQLGGQEVTSGLLIHLTGITFTLVVSFQSGRIKVAASNADYGAELSQGDGRVYSAALG